MAEQSAQDKTEAPTPERLRKAKQEGQVVQSQEVPSVMILGAMFMILSLLMPSLLEWFREMIVAGIRAGANGPTEGGTFLNFFRTQVQRMLIELAPILALGAGVSLFASAATSGLVYCPKNFKLDWSRVSPTKGIKNVVSLQSLVKLGMSLLKMALIGLICYVYFTDRLAEIIQLRWATPLKSFYMIGDLIFGVMIRVLIAMGVIALIDFAYQKWNYIKKMRMTKQEIKEERKQYEVSAEVKGKIRQIQFQMANNRMLQDVKEADVVITNPTHFAVALKYDPASMGTPIVVAKGPDHLAQQIKEVARESEVPIVERKMLARALFAACEVGDAVPSKLFVAVAEVLAMIFRLRRNRQKALKG